MASAGVCCYQHVFRGTPLTFLVVLSMVIFYFGWFAVDECSCVWNWLWPGVKICGNEVIRASCVCGLSSGHSQTKFVRCVVVPRTLNWVGFEVVLVAFVR